MNQTFQPAVLSHWDYVVIALFFGVNLFVGWWCSKKSSAGIGNYFLGSGLPWWAVAVSYYATATSSISFMALPANTYSGSWLEVGPILAGALSGVAVALLFVPMLRRLDVTTIYEYIERRFGRGVRLLGAFLGIVTSVVSRMSVVLLLPALALSTVTGVNVYLAIALMGIITIIYSTEGGFNAVVWTDFIQAVVMFLSIGVVLWFVVSGVDGGFSAIFASAETAGKIKMLSADWSLEKPTLLVSFGFFVATIFVIMADQSLMQRIFASKNEKAAQTTILFGTGLGLANALLFFGIGTCIWAFFHTHPGRVPGSLPNDAIFPFFVANELPVGIVGLIVASILAASMSTLSSAVNSSAAIVECDFYLSVRPQATATERMRVARWASVICGTLATATAMYLASQDVRSLWEKTIELTALFGGAFPGVFALGLLTRRANAGGIFVGVAGSVLVTLWVQTQTSTSAFLSAFVALAACFCVGYLASFFFRPAARSLEGLTLHTLKSSKQPS